MKKNLGAKPYLFPQPVMIIASYDEHGKANAMNAAWGGIVGMDQIIISLGDHQTTDNIMINQAFTVSMADVEHVAACCFKEWGRSCCDQRNCLSGNSLPRYWTCS